MVEPTPFTHVSGYANRFKEMLTFMQKAGDDVDVITTDTKTPHDDLPTSFMRYPITHTTGFTFPLYDQISLTFDVPDRVGLRVMEEFKPHVIHVTSPGFLLFAAMVYAKIYNVPLVMSYHTHLPSYGKNYLSFVPGIERICWQMLRMAHARADLTLVTSPQMRAELRSNGIPRVDVWRKGIDTERFHPSFYSYDMRSQMTDGHPDDFLMVYVGRLGGEKRLKDIKAMLEIMPSNTRLCIVGKGPQREELDEWFEDTGRTKFMGQMSGDALSQAFASADVFVMPSDSETLGFVVLESMASGVPVVGAAAGGIPDLIHDGVTGFLVEPGDTRGFVQKLETLRDPTFRAAMGKEARTEAERWGWEAATSFLRNEQYEKAIRNFRRRRLFKSGLNRVWKGFWRYGGPRTLLVLWASFRTVLKEWITTLADKQKAAVVVSSSLSSSSSSSSSSNNAATAT